MISVEVYANVIKGITMMVLTIKTVLNAITNVSIALNLLSV
jgi:hypothetical protein